MCRNMSCLLSVECVRTVTFWLRLARPGQVAWLPSWVRDVADEAGTGDGAASSPRTVRRWRWSTLAALWAVLQLVIWMPLSVASWPRCHRMLYRCVVWMGCDG